MDISQFMGGNYLSAAQLPQPVQTWTISNVQQVTVDGQSRIAVSFHEAQKALLCNKTNLNKLGQAFGTNSDAWLQQRVEVYTEQVNFQGRTVPGIRVRPAQQPPAQPAQPQPVAAPQPQQPAAWTGQQPPQQ